MSTNYVFETTVGNRKLIVETGKYTEQANGTCWVKCGETVVQASVTMADSPRVNPVIQLAQYNTDFPELIASKYLLALPTFTPFKL